MAIDLYGTSDQDHIGSQNGLAYLPFYTWYNASTIGWVFNEWSSYIGEELNAYFLHIFAFDGIFWCTNLVLDGPISKKVMGMYAHQGKSSG